MDILFKKCTFSLVLNIVFDLQKEISNKFCKLTYFCYSLLNSSAELIFKLITSSTDPP